MEPAKSISGRRIDFLGYAIDVDQQLVVIAKKNVLKALDAYLQASIDGRSLKVIEFQALASYAVRYRTICGLMVAPFMRALYVNIRGKNQYAVVKVSPASARTFILMRALLIFGMEGISGAQRGAEYSPPTSALRVAECGEIWEGPIVPSCDGLLREPQSGREMEGSR